MLEVHFVSGIIWHDLIKTTTSVLCYYLGPELSLHLNSLAVQRALRFWLSLKWHKPTTLSGNENQVKVGDGLNTSQAVWMGVFQFCLNHWRTRKALPFGVMPIDYTYWKLHYWFTFLWESLLAHDLCKYSMIFGGSSWMPSYCFHFSMLANNLPAGFQFPYCVIVVW